MKRLIDCCLILLIFAAVAWLISNRQLLSAQTTESSLYVLSIISLYLLSHLFRMMRLAVLTLDQRDKIFPLVAAHALTAFPSSLIPFKIGEILRLTSFFVVYSGHRKALAVWLVERFFDLVIICSLISILYVMDIDVSTTLKLLFIIFFMAGSLAVLVFFSVAKLFVFINRYLVLSSHTKRGLYLLRISHALRGVELEIYKSIEGRLSGLLLLSAAIWLTEILVLFVLLGEGHVELSNVAHYFVQALSGIVRGSGVEFNALYSICQTLPLIGLSLGFGLSIMIGKRVKRAKG